MPKRKITSPTSWIRTGSTAAALRRPRRHTAIFPNLARLALTGLLGVALGVAPTPPPVPPLATILNNYAAAANPNGIDVGAFESSGTLAGEGLTGDFHSWHQGDADLDDQRLGLRRERTLRRGDRIWVQDANGAVRELRGYLLRHERTLRYVDSGAFVQHPETVNVLGPVSINGVRTVKLEVRAPGGEPEWVYLDLVRWLPVRLEYIEGDGPTTVDLSDYRTVSGRLFAFRAVVSSGDHAFDVIETTTAVSAGTPIAEGVFAPLVARTIECDGVETVRLEEHAGHAFVHVTIGTKTYAFLVDTGAQSVLLDTRVARELGLKEEGAMQARGATRIGGVHQVFVPALQIGKAVMHDVVATSIDLAGSTGGALRLDGILGATFFAAALVELDPGMQTMRFGKPGAFTPNGTRVATDVDRGLIEAQASVNGVTGPFLIDTGNGVEVLLYRWFVDAHPGLVPFTGAMGGSYGVGGLAAAYHTTIDTLDFAGFPLYHRVTDVVLANAGAFADRHDAGNIGWPVLRNFVLTVDQTNGALYVRSGSAFDDGRRRTVNEGLGISAPRFGNGLFM